MSWLSGIARTLRRVFDPTRNPIVKEILQVTHLQDSPVFGILSSLLGGSGSDLLGSLCGAFGPGLLSVIAPEIGLPLEAIKLLGPLMSGYWVGGGDSSDEERVPMNRRVMENLTRPIAGPRLAMVLGNRGVARSEIDSILNDPTLSPDQKFVLLAALVADMLDKKIEKLMKQWAEEAEKAASDDKQKAAKADKRSNILQTKIQQLMAEKNKLLSVVSNILRSNADMAKIAINNTRA